MTNGEAKWVLYAYPSGLVPARECDGFAHIGMDVRPVASGTREAVQAAKRLLSGAAAERMGK